MIKQKFIIMGDPIPQKRHRMGRGFSYDPSAPDKKRVRTELLLSNKKKFIHKGSVNMFITFFMKRPKGDYRSGKFSHMLNKNASLNHIKKPDIDNLLKFIMDCCNGIIYKDDSQVNRCSVTKIYCNQNGSGVKEPQTHIEIILNKGEK